jgi:predicted thioredoxin/glutaredoxin
LSRPRFQLLTRVDCHLCELMKEVVEEVLAAHGLTFTVEDVDSDSNWQDRFGEVVPVLLRDGALVAKIRIDRRQLERIVRRRRF